LPLSTSCVDTVTKLYLEGTCYMYVQADDEGTNRKQFYLGQSVNKGVTILLARWMYMYL